MGWSYKFWVDKLYPPKLKAQEYLQEYSKHFNSVEVNSSFYRVPSVSTIKKWKEETNQSFLFSVKTPKKITHEKWDEDKLDYLDFFFNTISNLEYKLGPILFQFPLSFKSESFEALRDMISVLPSGFRYAFEFRNKSWFRDNFFDLLEDNKIALVLGDSPWVSEVENVTSDFVYFRWEGNRKQVKGTLGSVEKERTNDIEKWAKKIQTFPDKTEVFGYFSKYFSGYPPADVEQILQYLGENTR